ncbi:hypothetical protein AGR5A_Lc30033 [Agrobacterium genomosp. 5 str. CFBP 6626]|nr:hypothetical protein AGR5A_Lc30033 [Agrobacterium genomosp. 5 str. CFBP 6626]
MKAAMLHYDTLV